MNRSMVIFLVAVAFFSSTAFGYGEKVDSLLLWQERAVVVLTNACRMAPLAFRDRYIGNTAIMLPEKYPAVPPLYWNRELNAAARYHCVEMGLSCGMVHECNGVSFSDRLKPFYTKSSTIGENIAMGYQAPQQVVFAWLIDGQTAATAAPDGNGDGHRANIMSPRYREIGCGYYLAGTGKSAKPYWCQDFGGGKSTYSYHPVTAASHLFFDKQQITFWVAVYDTAEAVSAPFAAPRWQPTSPCPRSRNCTGGNLRGFTSGGTTCRAYSIEVALVNGQTLRYPETGTLVTVGEGTCAELSATAWRMPERSGSRSFSGALPQIRLGDNGIILTAAPGDGACPSATSVIDCCGSLRTAVRWNGGIARIPRTGFSQGMHLFVHTYPGGSTAVSRMPVTR